VNPLHRAIDYALAHRPLGDEDDPADWLRWVATTNCVNDETRSLILHASFEELAAGVFAGEAELEQRTARVKALNEVSAMVRRWCPPGGTVGEAVERCRLEGTPEEFQRFVSLNEAIAPSGVLTVVVDG